MAAKTVYDDTQVSDLETSGAVHAMSWEAQSGIMLSGMRTSSDSL